MLDDLGCMSHRSVEALFERGLANHDQSRLISSELGNPDNPGRALADFFKLENGKVVEHWDVIQEVAKTAVNDNGMF